jgi:hypothetical protein
MAGELLEFENGTIGQVFNLEEESIGASSSATTSASRKATPARAPAAA